MGGTWDTGRRADRREHVLRMRDQGIREYYNWRHNVDGPGSAAVLARLERGEALTWRELCAHPAFLPQLYLIQILRWLEDRCDVDREYSDDAYKIPPPGRNRTPDHNRVAFPSERLVDLYDDYQLWCAAPFQEAVPRGAFRFALWCHLVADEPDLKRRRFRRLVDWRTSAQELHVMGVTLRGSE